MTMLFLRSGCRRVPSKPSPGKISNAEAPGIEFLEMAAALAIERIVIETETPGDSRTMFRVRMNDLVIGQNLTAAQAHLIVGEVLDRITLPRPAKKHSEQS
jgi:hypothetical protein